MQNREFDKGPRRVVVTGLGVVSAIGIGKELFWDSLRLGRSGIREITSFDTSSYDCQIAGEITEFNPDDFMPAQTARRIDRFAQLGLAAARLAVREGGSGYCPGKTRGGWNHSRHVYRYPLLRGATDRAFL